MSVWVGSEKSREFEIELADQTPDWWAFLDATPFLGKQITFNANNLPEDSRALQLIEQSDEIKEHENLYHEARRPQFHFTARRGWHNDPNGLVYYEGEYHLFFQHNPYGWNWGNMHWGHAVSSDLVRWKELDEALYPDELGTMFSGSAVVDENNTAGLQKGSEKTLVAFYTAAGGDSPLSKGKQFSQCMAYSNDRGRTWTKYEKNPVVPHIVGGNRDPKVLWYPAENKWLMALYLDQSDFAILESHDLKSWKQLSKVTIPGTSECPEFFEIPIEGTKETRWIFYGGNGRYLVGKFDGKNFAPESGPHDLNRGNCFYASQTYNLPASDKRRILVPWGQINIPSMPFNQMIGLPVELKLERTGNYLQLSATPVAEIQKLRGKPIHTLKDQNFSGTTISQPVTEVYEFEIEFTPSQNSELRFDVHGASITYNAAKKEISCLDRKATLGPDRQNKVRIRALVDRVSIDIFGNDGAVYMPMGHVPKKFSDSFTITTRGDGERLHSLTIWPLKSAWEK